ncbi:MAG: hypothetical protein US30_C0006G0049 [Candidatus Moranbacteria bacterium GW2011_GWF2_36_839]|nr:MAG: hypothetical protein US27_C0006G0056 [Candidatus Moranbacteria bacterium GW2011_GWF1_36_78]KKQ17160.1 MAG: hypothetical protein US30_C0006G0049 [Candidatus Moranbacteria bacterium GW2011_GWF2_36_839]HAT74151.1 hypothetical protein [Candidatus Moranbacteria bacterium]
MAQFFGGRSKFLVIMQKANYITAIIMWIILVYLIYRYVGQFRSASIVSFVILNVLYLPIMY